MSGPPPFRLPGTHFAGALGWLVLGGAGLVVVAPDLAAGRFLAPRVLGVTHLYTVGVIVASVFGALYQFFPMSLGSGARSVRLGLAGAWALHLGTGLLVAGLWLARPALQAAGWTAILLAATAVSWNLLARRPAQPHARRVAAYVSAAFGMLGLALLLAGGRIGEGLGWWTLDRLGAIAAHFHLAGFGFAGLTAVGVGGRMLPMFLVSGTGPEWPMRVIGPAASGGLVVLAGGLVAGFVPATWLGALLGVGAAALFVGTVAGYFRRRLVRELEPAFGHVLAGFVSLGLALTVGLVQLALPGLSLRGWVLYAELVLLGWLVLFITGIWYRLFAFLIWLHIYGRFGAGRKTAPELVHRGLAWSALGFMATGVALLAGGTAAGSASVARTGAAAVLAGSLLMAVQYLRMLALSLTRAEA